MEGFGSSLVRVLLFLWTRTLEKGIIGFLSKQYLRFLTFRRRFYLLFASGKRLKITFCPIQILNLIGIAIQEIGFIFSFLNFELKSLI